MKKALIFVLVVGAIGASAYHIVTQTREREVNIKYLDARQAYVLHDNHSKALALLTELVDVNYPLAFYELGVMYEKGQATEVDMSKATALYKKGYPYLIKGAEKRDDSALSYLGEMYLYGRGVDIDYDRARGYFGRIKSELLEDYVKKKLAEIP